jgi:hypothetical protein
VIGEATTGKGSSGKFLQHVIMNVTVQKSSKGDKKYDAVIDGSKTVSFGAKGYSDFTKNKDPERKDNYISRHKTSEDWGKSGVKSAGFWAKHVLWNKPTLKGSIDDINRRFKSLKVSLK